MDCIGFEHRLNDGAWKTWSLADMSNEKQLNDFAAFLPIVCVSFV